MHLADRPAEERAFLRRQQDRIASECRGTDDRAVVEGDRLIELGEMRAGDARRRGNEFAEAAGIHHAEQTLACRGLKVALAHQAPSSHASIA